MDRNGTERPVVKDLTFLIPNQKHLDLLKVIFEDMRTAVIKALKTVTGLHSDDELEIVIQYGAFHLTVICLGRICGYKWLLYAAVDAIEQMLLVLYPVSASLVIHGADMFIAWAELRLWPGLGRYTGPT